MITVVIQAGGESTRMGTDKGLLPFLGKPLIERVIQRISALADELIITTNRPDAYRFLNLPCVTDLLPGRGALGGVYTALYAATQPFVAILACDMPFVCSELLVAQRDILLHTRRDIAIPHSGEGLEPFHAIYRRDPCLGAVENAIKEDQWRVDSWFYRVQLHILGLEEIRKYDPRLACFLNVNTPQELAEAEQLALQIDSNT